MQLMAVLTCTVVWGRIIKRFFFPSDNFATSFTVLLEQRTFWSSFTATISTLLLHCCNCNTLCNIFTAFQDKELFFLFYFWIHDCFQWKSALALFNFPALKDVSLNAALYCIENGKWEDTQLSRLTLTLAVKAAGRHLTFRLRKGESPWFCRHSEWDMNGDHNF